MPEPSSTDGDPGRDEGKQRAAAAVGRWTRRFHLQAPRCNRGTLRTLAADRAIFILIFVIIASLFHLQRVVELPRAYPSVI